MTAPAGFAAAILTHGRPDRVITDRTLRRSGYTGPIHYVIDDEDPTGPEYVERYGPDHVHTFSKTEWATRFDPADTSADTATVVYARNASQHIMRALGYTHFIQLDDDYDYFQYRWLTPLRTLRHSEHVTQLDPIFTALVDLLETTGAATVAMAQGGDYIGGSNGRISRHHVLRKAMNSFVLNTNRPLTFTGRINEDVNTYVLNGSRGQLLFTSLGIMLHQQLTQSQPGGMTDIYLTAGTYVKSFYTVMLHPSSVRIGRMAGGSASRWHHHITWDHTAPKILHASHRKPETP